jgi:acetyltransferase-like isoleucine patch superfamily enzyme
LETEERLKEDPTSDGLHFLEDVYRFSGEKRSLRERLKGIRAQVRLEIAEMHFAFNLVNVLLAPVPLAVARRLRPMLYRRLGMRIGRGTLLSNPWHLQGLGRPYKRLTVGEYCLFRAARIELNAPITIGDYVTVSNGATITTDTHEVGPPERRLGHIKSRPVTIGDGAWIQRNVMLLGVSVGAGAIVGSGAVVTKDVPPNTFVAGVPARVVSELSASVEGPREEQVVEP